MNVNLCLYPRKTSTQAPLLHTQFMRQNTENYLNVFNGNTFLAQKFLKRSSFLMENSPGFLEEILKFGEVFFFPFISIVVPEKMLAVYVPEEGQEVQIVHSHQPRSTSPSLFAFTTLTQVLRRKAVLFHKTLRQLKNKSMKYNEDLKRKRNNSKLGIDNMCL